MMKKFYKEDYKVCVVGLGCDGLLSLQDFH